MAYEFYVTVDGIPGEASGKKHKDKISAIAYSYAVQAPVSGGGSGGGAGGGYAAREPQSGSPLASKAGAGKPTQTPVTITKRFDRATPKLFEALVKGKHIKFVIIEFERKVAGTPAVYYTLRLEDVTISHIGQYTDGSQPGPGGVSEFEAVSFSAKKIRIEHKQFGPKGGVIGTIVVEWDWAKMK